MRKSFKPEFEFDIRNARKRLGIPKEGFEDRKDRHACLKNPMKAVVFIAALESIIRDYKIPSAYTPILDEYIFFSEAYLRKQQVPEIAIIEPPMSMLRANEITMEDYYWNFSEPYAKLLIPGNSKKNDVIEFIDKNWNKVEAIFKKQDWTKPKKVRRTDYKERNKLINVFWSASIKQLQEYADKIEPDENHHVSTRKESLIKTILKHKYKNLDDGYIRKIGSRK